MQLRKLVLACGFVSFALSNYASALGLGDVKLNSTLNQPLNAEIKLLDTRDLSAEQILIALASPADFERNGVDRLYFYTEFQFEVEMEHPGGPIVRVTTRNSVREPYLNFLIEARWSAGRLLREYTVLMDLPTFDSTAPRTVQAAPSVNPKVSTQPKVAPVAPISEPVPTASSTASATDSEAVAEQDRPKKKSKVSGGTYGPISEKDRLWDIAKAVRPDSSVSVHQTMLALQRLNPDAFIRGNINLLKKGHVLRIPDTNEVATVSRSDAVNQVAAQNNRWTAPDVDTDMGAQLDASRVTPNNIQKSEPVSGRVKLEAPSAAENTADGQGSGGDKAGGKGAEAQLAANLEELDRAKSENSELTSRVQDLEEQIKTMQRLVDASNEKMRALQLNATKQADATAAEITEAQAAPAAVEQTTSVEATSADATLAQPTSAQAASIAAEQTDVAELSSVAASSAAVAAVPAAGQAASSTAKKKVANTVKPQEKTLLDHISNNLLWVGLGAAGLIAAGAAALAYKRRKEDEESDKEYSEAEPFYIPEPNFEHLNQPEDAIPTQLEPEEDLVEDERATVIAETDDVVSEAGIYISLGKYPQAEDMLLNALETGPASSEIYLKLLEVYSHTQNVTEFDRYYAALWPLASPVALNRAAELRAAIVDAGDFQGTTQVFAEEDSDITPVDENINVSARRYDMDFGSAPTPVSPSNINVADDEFVLDFETSKTHPEAEDLSDISLALDSLENREEPVPAAAYEVGSLTEKANQEEDLSFDFNELEQRPEELKLADDHSDDFNLEMDMADVDLAALDREMESFDADAPLVDPAAKKDTDVITEEDLEGFDALFAEDTQTPINEVSENQVVADSDNFAVDLELDEDLTLALDGDDNFASSTFDVNEEYKEELPLERTDKVSNKLESADAIAADLDSATHELTAELADLQHHDDQAAANEVPPLVEVSSDQDVVEEEISEDVFNQAMSDFSAESLNAEALNEPVEAPDNDLDFMVDADEAATKLDLARAYLDMGDSEGARDILAEVAQEGTAAQREEAIGLLSRIDV